MEKELEEFCGFCIYYELYNGVIYRGKCKKHKMFVSANTHYPCKYFYSIYSPKPERVHSRFELMIL